MTRPPARSGPSPRAAQSLTGIPAALSRALAWAMVNSPKWKIEAASTAEAWPSITPATRSSSDADAARGDHRHLHRVGDGAGQAQIEAQLGAVAVHRGEQDFARARFAPCAWPIRPRRGRWPCLPPWVKTCHLPGPDVLGVDGDDDALAAEFLGRLAHQIGPRHRRGVDRGLVGPGQQAACGCPRPRARRRPRSSGMKHCSAVRAHHVKSVARFSDEAVMSRKHSSSAPSAS